MRFLSLIAALLLTVTAQAESFTYSGTAVLYRNDASGFPLTNVSSFVVNGLKLKKVKSGYQLTTKNLKPGVLLQKTPSKSFQGETVHQFGTHPDGSLCESFIIFTTGGIGKKNISFNYGQVAICENGAYADYGYTSYLKRKD